MVLGIYGSGGEGRGVLETALAQNRWREIVFIDDTVEQDVFKGISRMPFEKFSGRFGVNEAEIVIALGETDDKKNLYDRVKAVGYSLANVIHPWSQVSDYADLGEGIIVQLGAIIASDTIIGDNVTVGQHSIVEHDTVLKKHVHISAQVMVSGHCKIGAETYVGIGALIRDRVFIGEKSIIGMGAVVVNDIPSFSVVVGNPASIIRRRGKEKIFKNR